jgi:D-glycero-D-manno-heptose 1,7-bisphosphate phosphatase
MIFDKDGTLVGSVDRGNGQTRPANTSDEQVLLPGVYDEISKLRKAGHQIAIASNQGGVAWGFMTFGQANALMQDCVRKLGGESGEIAFMFCPYDPRAAGKPKSDPQYARESIDRKPNPGMIEYLRERFNFSHEETVYVGDQETDRQAAEAAGVRFIWAEDFFTGIDPWEE